MAKVEISEPRQVAIDVVLRRPVQAGESARAAALRQRLEREVAAIERAGGTVDIPGELP